MDAGGVGPGGAGPGEAELGGVGLGEVRFVLFDEVAYRVFEEALAAEG